MNFISINSSYPLVFQKSLKIVDGKMVADSLATIGLQGANIGTYNLDFGLPVSLKETTEEIKVARLELNQLYDKHSSQASFAKSVMNSTALSHLSSRAQDKLKGISRVIDSNLELFQSEHAMNCFLPGTQETCPKIVKNISTQITEADTATLNLLRGAYYFNVNYNWPTLLVRNEQGAMDVYLTDLTPAGTVTHDLKVTPSIDYGFVSLGGGYSTYSSGVQTRYYMDNYGAEDLIYKTYNSSEYAGTIPWNTCVGGRCSKVLYNMVLIPF